MKDKRVILTFQYLRSASSNSLETSEYVYVVLNVHIGLKRKKSKFCFISPLKALTAKNAIISSQVLSRKCLKVAMKRPSEFARRATDE